MVDRLAVLLDRFSVSAQVFNAGALCGINTLEADTGLGQLHLIRQGPLEVVYGATSLRIDEPSLLLFPRALTHRFISDPVRGADMTCATLRFEGGDQNPICAALPDAVCLPLSGIHGAGDVLALLFEEAFTQRCGRTALVNRLFEVAMIQVLRQLMETGEVKGGMLAGLSHPRLRNAIVAMHEAPAKDWTLEELARVAGMSRTVFASTFRESLGITPGQLTRLCREVLGVSSLAVLQARLVHEAQRDLVYTNTSIKRLASNLGFEDEGYFGRFCRRHTGLTPRDFRAKALGALDKPVPVEQTY